MPEREHSRKKKKEQIRQSPNKYPLSIHRRGLVFLGIASGIGLATGAYWLTKPKIEIVNPAVSPSKQPDQQKSELLTFRQRLFELDSMILSRPQSLKEIAPEVGSIAKRYFDSEMGYPANRIKTNIAYLWEDEYQQRVDSHKNCTDQSDNISADTRGFTEVFTNNIIVNINFALGNDRDRVNGKIEEHAASTLFSILVHELHHAAAPIARFIPAERSFDPILQRVIEAEFNKGLAWFTNFPELSLPGRKCISQYRGMLEEAVTHDSTSRMLDKIGFHIPSQYDKLVTIYRKEVVDKLFKGNYRILLVYQQNTQPQGLFIEVGKQLGYQNTQQQLEQGEHYFSQIFRFF